MNRSSAPALALSAPARRALHVVLGTALAYALAGLLARWLAIPPATALPLAPAAGVALAAALVYGGPALVGVFLGAWVVHGPWSADWPAVIGPGGPSTWPVLALAIALGAALQAATGRLLLRRPRDTGPTTLDEPRDVLRFALLAAGLGSTVSASVVTAVATWHPAAAPGGAVALWWTWWLGDALGVLIGTPVILAWIGEPRSSWRPRRLTLVLPLLVAAGLLALTTTVVARWDALRARTVFERDTAQADAALDTQLLAALHTLEAVRGVFLASDDVSLLEMRSAAAPWLAMALPVQAIGHAVRVPRAQLAEFERKVLAEDGRVLHVFDRHDGDPKQAPPADEDQVVIRFIEPEDSNAAALGLNARSVPSARTAIERTLLTDTAAATAPFRLTQVPGDESGVVVYRALYAPGTPGQPDARRSGLRGVVFVSLRMGSVIEMARRGAQSYLDWCLVDADVAAPRRRLAGAHGCEQRLKPEAGRSITAGPDTLSHQHSLSFAGRRWQLWLGASASQVPDVGRGNAWLFSLVGLVATGLLTTLLLLISGRTRRIEVAVAERTADLEREAAERARTEQALRDSERRFRNIFDQAPVGIVYADLDGRIREANPRLRDMAGLGTVPLIRKRIPDLLRPEDRDVASRQLARLSQGGRSVLWPPARLNRHDGQEMWVQTGCSVLLDAVGRPERLVAVMEDITERRRRQAAEQGRALAESANRAKSEFLSRMSHELRTPLNAMLGFAQLLELDRRQPLATHQADWAGQILRAGWHLLDMINDTLDLSRIEAGETRLAPARLDLPPLVQHCVAMLETAATRRGISLATRIDPAVPPVMADETRLRQVLTNLLSNAVKYNVDDGRVLVTAVLADDGQTVEMRVCDSGLGLSEAQLGELFQPFNRLGRESGPIEGTGIGLVISRRLAELMGGSLQVEPGGGGPTALGDQGTTFVLKVPIAPGGAQRDTVVEPPATRTWPAGDRLRHVHYIEDNETNIEVLRGALLQRPQVRLTVSMLGLDGLAQVQAHPPDLLLLDMHLPDVDGLALLEQLQADPVGARVPVVVLSADATPTRVQQALSLGARSYLTKPLELAQFLAVLDAQLAEADSRFG